MQKMGTLRFAHPTSTLFVRSCGVVGGMSSLSDIEQKLKPKMPVINATTL
ncbi:MAG: hypothetical protein JRI32_09665 [Deltaproteobacteria bacterium]|nr:hypothetical protein [Deltaproteobacteria bacterium]